MTGLHRHRGETVMVAQMLHAICNAVSFRAGKLLSGEVEKYLEVPSVHSDLSAHDLFPSGDWRGRVP